MDEKKYQRILETQIKNQLNIFGAICIMGPKQVGKTYLSKEKLCNSYIIIDSYSHSSLLENEINNPIFSGATPRLIDEWQTIPKIWDKVIIIINQREKPGLFVLTGSSKPINYENIIHGTSPKIKIIQMHTLSWYEIINPDKSIKLSDLFLDQNFQEIKQFFNLKTVAKQLEIGGWPLTNLKPNQSKIILDSYVDAIIKINPKIDEKKSLEILKEIARLNGAEIKIGKILSKLSFKISKETLEKFLENLKSEHIIFDLDSWFASTNIRSKTTKQLQFQKSYFCDPSLALRILGKNHLDLLNDLNTMGIYFENQVIKDLMVYASALNGKLSLYKRSDETNKLDASTAEVDAIMELDDGNWAAIEIKLTDKSDNEDIYEKAKKLVLFKQYVEINKIRKINPKFLLIITAFNEKGYAYSISIDVNNKKEKVFVIPHDCLGI